MSGTNVIEFPAHRSHPDPVLSKRQLAHHFQRSTRWVELRVREGMPAEWDSLHQRRMFRLRDVTEWLEGRAA